MDQLVDKIATSLAAMHSGDSIHGDLTTSNIMIKPKLPLDLQMSGESCKLSAQEIAASGDLGDLVSPLPQADRDNLLIFCAFV